MGYGPKTYAAAYGDRSQQCISVFELPSTERGTNSDAPLKTWTHAMGDLKIVDFTMDPAPDLLVLVALAPPQCESVYQIHLRSFTTNEPNENIYKARECASYQNEPDKGRKAYTNISLPSD
ncbi:hypothetical protein B0H13DRAFT_2358137 [Mycena leptocephala]|nr:hypothetical protein B0H13DRAFT_2358137 [Mycena leptocephala]